MDLRSMEVTTYAADAVIFATGGERRDLRAIDEFGGVHRLSAGGAFSAGRGLRERGNSSRCIRRRSRAKTSFG